MRVVQHAIDQIVGMIPMRHGRVSATGSMDVLGLCGGRSASIRVRVTDLDTTLVDVSFVVVMHMAIVQVVDVSVVADRHMTAIRAVCVIMSVVRLVLHVELLFNSSIQ
tara:strand:- start:30 stop:353 length:324 start_codon:yes stop_codon:yes gene_type:complete